MTFYDRSFDTGKRRDEFCYLDKGGWVALVGGGACAFTPFASERLRWIMSYLKILIHEVGHSVVAWSFGYPGVPTFNLQHGGGVARHGPQASWLLTAISIVFVLFVIKNFKNPTAMVLSGIGACGYILSLSTPFHKMIELYMGHGFELLLATVFIYRAASNWAVHHGLERFLYGFAGFYLIYENIVFVWLLLFDKGYRQVYFDGIAPGLLNDFYRIWVEHLKTASFDHLATFHGVLTILCPVFAIGLHYLMRRNSATF